MQSKRGTLDILRTFVTSIVKYGVRYFCPPTPLWFRSCTVYVASRCLVLMYSLLNKITSAMLHIFHINNTCNDVINFVVLVDVCTISKFFTAPLLLLLTTNIWVGRYPFVWYSYIDFRMIGKFIEKLLVRESWHTYVYFYVHIII